MVSRIEFSQGKYVTLSIFEVGGVDSVKSLFEEVAFKVVK